MSHLWGWVYRKDEEPPRNPFDGLLKALGTGSKSAESYDAFDDTDLPHVFSAIANDETLRTVALISLYSGLRLSECLRAERKTLGGVDCWVVPEGKGKSENSVRVVPVHPRVASLEVPSGEKAVNLSVTFGRRVRPLKLGEGKTFHSLRKCFTTALERANCPEMVAVRLLGHSPISLTYKVYSKARDAAQLREWVEKVYFPV
jgi:integrase